jgi:UDP-N-acetylmuramyl pentapeptide phosphotransferase/UDP-N-acetylglucosamine-1-phosphate transferase
MNPKNDALLDHHMFSIMLLLPYVAVAFGLFKFNAYPSKVFVGDTFCYFSGVVFAVTGILGNFKDTASDVHPADHKLPVFSATTVWVCSMSASSPTQI